MDAQVKYTTAYYGGTTTVDMVDRHQHCRRHNHWHHHLPCRPHRRVPGIYLAAGGPVAGAAARGGTELTIYHGGLFGRRGARCWSSSPRRR
eukprot:6555149-Pyramimonas_sp.AAC.2